MNTDIEAAAQGYDDYRRRATEAADKNETCAVIDCDERASRAYSVCEYCQESREELLKDLCELFEDDWLTQKVLSDLRVACRDDLGTFWRKVAQSVPSLRQPSSYVRSI